MCFKITVELAKKKQKNLIEGVTVAMETKK